MHVELAQKRPSRSLFKTCVALVQALASQGEPCMLSVGADVVVDTTGTTGDIVDVTLVVGCGDGCGDGGGVGEGSQISASHSRSSTWHPGSVSQMDTPAPVQSTQ